MLHIEKDYYSSSTICKKSQVDIFKITPTGRSKKTIIKKTTLYIWHIMEIYTFELEKDIKNKI